MGVYRGSATLAGQPGSKTDVEVRLGGDRLVLTAGPALIGDWPLSEIVLARRVTGFVLRAEGEELHLSVAEADAFWAEAGSAEGRLAEAVETLELRTPGDAPRPPVPVPAASSQARPSWWRFWDPAAWREWRWRRAARRAYTAELRSLAARIDQSRRFLSDSEESLVAAKRARAWASGVGPRHIPIEKAASETGLATVPAVTLHQVGPGGPGEAWTPVDTGAVHYTDRRMVFAGSRNVEFRFDDLSAVEARPDGLFVLVSSHTRPHLLGGDAERLMSVLESCRAVAGGGLPGDPFEVDIDRLDRTVATSRAQLDELNRSRAGLVAPPRPVSPAWVPVSVAVLLMAVVWALPSGSGGAALVEPSVTTLAPPTSTNAPEVEPTVAAVVPPPPAGTAVTTSPDEDTSTATTGVTDDDELEAAGRPAPGDLAVYFFDVGQGDSTLLAGPDFTILIDAGRHDRSDVPGHLRHAGVETLDLVVGTHPHADHIGQIPAVLAAFEVQEVWMSGDSHTTLTFSRAVDAILESEAGYHEPRAGEVFQIGSAGVEVLNPTTLTGDLHAGSISLRVVFGEVAFLFTGDAETATEQSMVDAGLELGALVLQVGHHGSSTSTSSGFLAAVAPAVAVYSAATGNQYGHPHDEVIDRLLSHGVEVYGTDVHGTVVLVTDGVDYTVTNTR